MENLAYMILTMISLFGLVILIWSLVGLCVHLYNKSDSIEHRNPPTPPKK
jgi:hypothetical protein